jgi:TPR repeat protein
LDLQDYDQALEAKAEGGDAEAQYAMAALYAVGLGGVSRDEKRAFGYATKAAAQEHPGAQYFVAICTEEGRYTKRDAAKARVLYEKAAAAGHLGALNNLAVLQEEEGDEKAAVAGYTKAAASLANAQYNLGRLIEAGKAEGDAAALYRKAALQGHQAAQNNLGVMHQTGKGAEKDLEEAERWFRYAANQGHLEAMFNLGQFTALGQGGLQVDRVQAFEWWGRVALTGHEAATTQLAALANGMTEAEKTQGRARVEMWRNNNEVNQYFVIRKGD